MPGGAFAASVRPRVPPRRRPVRHRGAGGARSGLGPSLGQVRHHAGGTRQAVPLRGLFTQRVPHRDGLRRSHGEGVGPAQARVPVHGPGALITDLIRAIRTQRRRVLRH